jgi:hypothetical protein
VKGDTAGRFQARVLGDGCLRQFRPDHIFAQAAGDASLVVMAGKNAGVGLPIGRFVGADYGRFSPATQIAGCGRSHQSLANHDITIFLHL